MLRSVLPWAFSSSLAALVLHGVPQDPKPDPTQAPPLQVTVTIDGVAHQLVDGVAAEIEIGGQKARVQADVAPLRHFAAAGIEFDYPRDMLFEFESSDVMRTWTLTGGHVTVMVFCSKALTPEELIDSTLDGIADVEGTRPEACTEHIGGAEVPAKKVQFSAGHLEDIAFGLDRGEQGATVFLVQLWLADDGSRSSDCQRMLELLLPALRPAPR